MRRYREFLEITPATPMLNMGEGSTPLVKSRYLGNAFSAAMSFTSSWRGATRPAHSKTGGW